MRNADGWNGLSEMFTRTEKYDGLSRNAATLALYLYAGSPNLTWGGVVQEGLTEMARYTKMPPREVKKAMAELEAAGLVTHSGDFTVLLDYRRDCVSRWETQRDGHGLLKLNKRTARQMLGVERALAKNVAHALLEMWGMPSWGAVEAFIAQPDNRGGDQTSSKRDNPSPDLEDRVAQACAGTNAPSSKTEAKPGPKHEQNTSKSFAQGLPSSSPSPSPSSAEAEAPPAAGAARTAPPPPPPASASLRNAEINSPFDLAAQLPSYWALARGNAKLPNIRGKEADLRQTAQWLWSYAQKQHLEPTALAKDFVSHQAEKKFLEANESFRPPVWLGNICGSEYRSWYVEEYYSAIRINEAAQKAAQPNANPPVPAAPAPVAAVAAEAESPARRRPLGPPPGSRPLPPAPVPVAPRESDPWEADEPPAPVAAESLPEQGEPARRRPLGPPPGATVHPDVTRLQELCARRNSEAMAMWASLAEPDRRSFKTRYPDEHRWLRKQTGEEPEQRAQPRPTRRPTSNVEVVGALVNECQAHRKPEALKQWAAMEPQAKKDFAEWEPVAHGWLMRQMAEEPVRESVA